MKRPDISDFERETYDGQDYADWFQDYYQALEKYADFLEEELLKIKDTISNRK